MFHIFGGLGFGWGMKVFWLVTAGSAVLRKVPDFEKFFQRDERGMPIAKVGAGATRPMIVAGVRPIIEEIVRFCVRQAGRVVTIHDQKKGGGPWLCPEVIRVI
jgi:hypothetical protein